MAISHHVRSWLLEEENPSVKYLTLRFLEKESHNTAKYQKAEKDAYTTGLIGTILDNMHPDGYWLRPGSGYNPKYRSGVWSLILLSQLGAQAKKDTRIEKACQYYLDHAYSPGGYFSVNGVPSGTIDCLQGNMCAALTDLGVEDPRLDEAYDWLARSNTGQGVDRYYAYKCGPKFACGVNSTHPCAWGTVKVMLALSKIPAKKRTTQMQEAIEIGVNFLFSCNLVESLYPTRDGAKPSRNWWKFGFPVFYITDLLQNVEALVALGYGDDPRLQDALTYIKEKQTPEGKWLLDYDYPDKTWIHVGENGSQTNSLRTE